MKTIHELIRLHGDGDFAAGLARLTCGETGSGEPIKVQPPSKGFMPLTVEHVGDGPIDKTICLGVSHHYIQNGDVMYDPWVELLLPHGEAAAEVELWVPCAFEMSSPPIRREVYAERNGRTMIRLAERRDQVGFCRMWDRNLRAQGYICQFKKQIGGSS